MLRINKLTHPALHPIASSDRLGVAERYESAGSVRMSDTYVGLSTSSMLDVIYDTAVTMSLSVLASAGHGLKVKDSDDRLLAIDLAGQLLSEQYRDGDMLALVSAAGWRERKYAAGAEVSAADVAFAQEALKTLYTLATDFNLDCHHEVEIHGRSLL